MFDYRWKVAGERTHSLLLQYSWSRPYPWSPVLLAIYRSLSRRSQVRPSVLRSIYQIPSTMSSVTTIFQVTTSRKDPPTTTHLHSGMQIFVKIYRRDNPSRRGIIQYHLQHQDRLTLEVLRVSGAHLCWQATQDLSFPL